MMTVKEVIKLSGVSARTLQYYDRIGLLAPTNYTESGYRLYDTEALMKLQQILLYKELDFSLQEIKELLSDGTSDNHTRLLEQKNLLIQKQKRIENMIGQVRRLIKGETTMDFEVFKQTFATKMPENASEEAKEGMLALITPEMAERVEEVWGAKNFFDLEPKKMDDLTNYIQKANELLGKIILEDDLSCILSLVGEWVKCSVEFGQVPDERLFVHSMLKDYQTNQEVIASVEQQRGVKGRMKLIEALEQYLKKL